MKKFDCSKPKNHLIQNILFIGKNAKKIENKFRKNDPTI